MKFVFMVEDHNECLVCSGYFSNCKVTQIFPQDLNTTRRTLSVTFASGGRKTRPPLVGGRRGQTVAGRSSGLNLRGCR